MASKSQQKRQAIMTGADKNPGQPAWKDHQQKETQPKNNEDREKQNKTETGTVVKVRMLTDYRDVAKTGEVYATDAQKAEELVKLGRAEYLKKDIKKSADEPDAFQTGGDSE